MNRKDYTPENICLAMGVRGFRPEAPPSGWCARLVLTPSFHPELCMTITADVGRDPVVSLHASLAHLWTSGWPTQAHRVSTASVPLRDDLASHLFAYLTSEPASSARTLIACDGMGFDVAFRDSAQMRIRTGNVLLDLDMNAFLRQFIVFLHATIADLECLHALANAAWYLGLDLRDPGAGHSQPPLRLAVLGSEGDRAELLRALDAHVEGHGDSHGGSSR